MLRYYAWPVAEKAFSYVPFGRPIYNGLGYLRTRTSKRRLSSCGTSYPLIRKTREMARDGATVLDFGTAWHHHDAFLLYLVGEYKIYLFDIQDRAWLSYLKTYIEYLLENLPSVCDNLSIDHGKSARKLQDLLKLRTRDDLYRACNFTSIVTDVTDKPFLPEETLDFVVSNCVLPHIPPAALEPELRALYKMLKLDGYMYMMVGHDDHWSFHDTSANMFNYYRYSDKFYSLLFDTKFEYQNRLTKPEWPPIFERANLEIADYYGHVTEESRAAIRSLPSIDKRFARFSEEDLAIVYSYFLLRRRPEPGPKLQQASDAASPPQPADRAASVILEQTHGP
jgi:SAM-dependent methyltransferase